MFIVKFDTDNAAFEDNAEFECARILRHIAEQLCETGPVFTGHFQSVRDSNGNRIGQWKLTQGDK